MTRQSNIQLTGSDCFQVSPPTGEIDRIIENRDQGLAKLQQGLLLIQEAKRFLPALTLETYLANDAGWYSDDIMRSFPKARKRIDAQVWMLLLEKTKLGAVMNNDQLGRIKSEIKERAPEVTRELVLTTFMDLYETRYESFKKGLVLAFQQLLGKYKSHSAFKLKKRVILTDAIGIIGWQSFSGKKHLFDDMWRYCCLMDGTDPTSIEYDHIPSNILNKHQGAGEYEFDHFRVVIYKNGNIHIWFDNHMAIVEKINAVIAEYYEGQLPDDWGHRSPG